MNDQLRLIGDSALRLFEDLSLASRANTLDAGGFGRLWERITLSGFCLLFRAENDGGFGGGWNEAFAVIEAAGRCALALPLPEAMLANKLLDDAGAAPRDGVCTLALRTDGKLQRHSGRAPRFTGCMRAVPWGRYASDVIGGIYLGSDYFLCHARVADAASLQQYANVAGEPRDNLFFRDAETTLYGPLGDSLTILRQGALVRAIQIAGASAASLELSLRHANERSQFGKPIGKFQAIQHQLAIFAEQNAAVQRVSRDACAMFADGNGDLAAAIAKLRANIAVDTATAVAHQVHGAMGFTAEYALHPLTRRMMSWRSEFGSDVFWSKHIGGIVAAAGPAGFWPLITAGRAMQPSDVAHA